MKNFGLLMMDLGFCYKTANIWQTIGYGIFIIKIAVPILIIIFGIIDLGKAVISSEDKAIRKSAVSLLKKIIIGIIIFFVPTLINYAFSVIGKFSSVEPDYITCFDCLTSPGECDTSYQPEVLDYN